MEDKTDGNTSAPTRVEPANGSSASDDRSQLLKGFLIRWRPKIIEAITTLEYGRRQEAEEACRVLADAIKEFEELEKALDGKGQPSSEAAHGQDQAKA